MTLLAVLIAAVGFRAGVAVRLPNYGDNELVERFVGGERRAFDEIVVRYQARVYSLCYRWLGESEVAEEVAQDVFVALFRALPTFRGEASLSTFVFKVAINHCRNKRLYRMRRGFGRHESIDGPREEDEPERQLADHAATSDHTVHAREATTLITEALAALDEDHRHILILRDVEDLAYEEIAEILDLPRGTVKSRIHRARTELAAKLARKVVAGDVV